MLSPAARSGPGKGRPGRVGRIRQQIAASAAQRAQIGLAVRSNNRSNTNNAEGSGVRSTAQEGGSRAGYTIAGLQHGIRETTPRTPAANSNLLRLQPPSASPTLGVSLPVELEHCLTAADELEAAIDTCTSQVELMKHIATQVIANSRGLAAVCRELINNGGRSDGECSAYCMSYCMSTALCALSYA